MNYLSPEIKALAQSKKAEEKKSLLRKATSCGIFQEIDMASKDIRNVELVG